ncbi:MAG: dihydrolipoyl dehydrogenase [Candidatus Omnitrophica bacterium]|jgi:dihydrolipoamide dehydrogenase|nr:dihydrolipoyl dehydrogenase [Candidatus Omnitrophota bacterium]
MYDLAIIGAGWAGFNACLRAKELNLKVALIEKGGVGGTCLNLGCIPTKSLIHASKIFSLVKNSADFGVNASNPIVDFKKMQERKAKVVEGLQKGMRFLLKGVDFIEGEAKITSAQEINVNGNIIQTRYILLATGSKPLELDALKFDGEKILSSDQVLSLKEVPSRLLIIGAGVIGCEFASLFSNLGAKVTITEKMPQVLPGEDSQVASRLEGIFRKKGINVITKEGNLPKNLDDFDLVLACVGRSANTEISGLRQMGVALEENRILTDEYLKTSIENIYAAGDCTSKIMLAHFAGYQGRLAVDNIFSKTTKRSISYLNVPNCIFTDPEISSVGLSEENAFKGGMDIAVKKFDFLGLGLAHIIDETQGFLKIVFDKNSGVVLGCSIIGPRATEIISTLTLALSCRLKVQDLSAVLFAHPTISESISEALKQ